VTSLHLIYLLRLVFIFRDRKVSPFFCYLHRFLSLLLPSFSICPLCFFLHLSRLSPSKSRDERPRGFPEQEQPQLRQRREFVRDEVAGVTAASTKARYNLRRNGSNLSAVNQSRQAEEEESSQAKGRHPNDEQRPGRPLEEMPGSSGGDYDTPKAVVASWERAGRVMLHLRQFFWEMWPIFLIPACILEMLYCLGLAFPQMCPNFVRHVLALLTRAREINREFGCQVKTNARSDQGTYYISARPGSLVLSRLKACRNTNWRSKYFFFRLDRHSIGSFDPARMTRTWYTNHGKMEIRVSWFCCCFCWIFDCFCWALVSIRTLFFFWWFTARNSSC